MIYRLTTKEQFELARYPISENMIGFTWNKQMFALPDAPEDWEKLPNDIVAIEKDRWLSEKDMIIERTENEISQINEDVNYVEYVSERGCYLFKTLTDNYFEIYKTETITNKDAAIAYVDSLNATGKAASLANAKSFKVKLIKEECARLLEKDDWKVIRHRDQIASNQATSLTNEQYLTLLEDRNNLRLKSDLMESDINALNSVESVNAYVIIF